MIRAVSLGIALFAQPALAQELPDAINCYQISSNAKDIDAYMACFTEDAELIDVSRTFIGQEAIRTWAEREVIPGGDTFRHWEFLEQSDRYAKTEVNWLSWVVHYSYWWNGEGKITRISLQYAD